MEVAADEYNGITHKFSASKVAPWRHWIEANTIFSKILEDLSGKSILDLVCGDGHYTRRFHARGAKKVTGVDISTGMISLAQKWSKNLENVNFICGDARLVKLDQKYDIVTAIYLLCYADNVPFLREFAANIKRSLVPGGIFLAVNNNPGQDPATYLSTRKYGSTKHAEKCEYGEPLTIKFYDNQDSYLCEVTNYFFEHQVLFYVFREVGMGLEFVRPELSAKKSGELEYWQDWMQAIPNYCYIGRHSREPELL
jgi:SAM-dependent methyltransferase